MTYQPLLLSDNLFSVVQYPSHDISGNEEAAGHEAFRVGNGRRSVLDYWSPTTDDAAAYVQVVCNRVRAANCLVLDRGHNLDGFAVTVSCSSDSFTTSETAWTGDIPAASAPGSVDDPSGVRTEEGAFIKRFSLRAGLSWRVGIEAMGSGVVPQVVGVYLGLAWEPGRSFDEPWADDDDELGGMESESDAGWIGNVRPWNRRAGTFRLRLEDGEAYDQARLWVGGNFRQRSPMWICYDYTQAERAVCAIRQRGTQGFRIARDWTNKRQGEIAWQEHEPKAA